MKKERKASTKRGNDIFSLLKKDHRKVKALLSKIESSSDRAIKARTEMYETVREEITRHSKAEEKVVYPRLKKQEPTQDIAFESIEEHGVVKYLLGKLDTLDASAEEWMGCLTVLRESIEHHVKEEENEMFKKMRRAIPAEELRAMAEEFESAKGTLTERSADRLAA